MLRVTHKKADRRLPCFVSMIRGDGGLLRPPSRDPRSEGPAWIIQFNVSHPPFLEFSRP